MTASVGNIVLYILFLWIAPVFVGNAVCNRLSMRGTIPRSFVMGYLSMWAVFQIITVPLILLKVSFLVDVVVYSIFLVGIIAYGIVKRTYRSMTIPKADLSAWGGIIVMLAVGIYMIVQSYRLQLTNADDTRFVVNAVDTVRTNRMLLTDVNTGKEILSWTGDLFKDVISPWAVFAAYLSKITGISAASMMHTFLPPVLLAVMMCIFWLIAGELFDKHIYRSLFVILLLVMYMYGYFSIYNAETFTIIRLWQGKATMAAVGIPALLYAFLRLYRLLPDDRRLTKIGKFVRSTSIDELPQLINVLKGDMSLIGPRPLLPQYLSLYNSEQARRHEVRPGITGWAQVNGRNAISWTRKFELDVWYVDHCSFSLDLKIIFLTIKKVFVREGISSDTCSTMEAFNGNN